MKGTIAILLCISLVAGIFLYIGFGSSNTAEQLSLIYRMQDSSYLINDWFVNVSDGMNVRFYSSSFILLLNKIIPSLSVLYFLLFLVSCFLISLATYFISNHFFKDKKIALLTSFFVIFGANFTLGGVPIVPTVIVSMIFSMVFVLWGFYFFLKEKYLLFSLMFGIAIFFHFLLGGLIFGILFLAEVFNNPKGFKKYFQMSLFVILALLIISPIFISQLNTGLSLSGAEVVKILGEIRNPHHHMPFSWAPIVYAKFLFFFVLFWIAFKSFELEPGVKSIIKKIVYIIIILFFLGTFFVEIIPISFFVKLQLFRVSLFLSFIGYLFIVPYLYKKFEESFKKKLTLRVLYCLFLMVALFSSPLILIALPIFFIGEYIYKNQRDFFNELNKKEIILISMFPLTIAFLILFSGTINVMINQGIESVIVKSSIYMLFISFMLVMLPRKNYLKVLGIVLIIFLTCLVFTIRTPIITFAYEDSMQEMYDFIKNNTPIDTILLVPPYLEPFRLGTERAIAIDFKLCPYGEKGLVEWYERLKAVSNNAELNSGKEMVLMLKEGYQSLSEKIYFF